MRCTTQVCTSARGQVALIDSGKNQPLLVSVDSDRRDEPEHTVVVGEDPDDPRAALDLGVEPLGRVGLPDLRPVGSRERGEGEHVLLGVGQHGGNVRKPGLQSLSYPVELNPGGLATGLNDDRPDERCDHLGFDLSDPSEHVARCKCNRKRCQASPMKIMAIAALSPACASEITSPTPQSSKRSGPSTTPSDDRARSATSAPSSSRSRPPAEEQRSWHDHHRQPLRESGPTPNCGRTAAAFGANCRHWSKESGDGCRAARARPWGRRQGTRGQ